MLQRPDFTYIKWSPEEESLYSEESQTLGTALENGKCLHVDLQKQYRTSESPTIYSSAVREWENLVASSYEVPVDSNQ